MKGNLKLRSPNQR